MATKSKAQTPGEKLQQAVNEAKAAIESANLALENLAIADAANPGANANVDVRAGRGKAEGDKSVPCVVLDIAVTLTTTL